MKFSNLFILVITSLLLSCVTNSVAQGLKVGPSLGTYFSNKQGVNTVDSIKVVVDDVNQEAVVGIFAEGNISKRLILRTELNFFENFTDFAVFNDVEECQFCPVVKYTVASTPTLELVVLPKLQLPMTKQADLSLFAGPAVHFRFAKDINYIDFGRRHPGITEVVDELDKSVSPVHVYLAYGASIDFWRLSLAGRIIQSAGHSSNREIEVYGKKYPIRFRDKFLFVTLSYKFNISSPISKTITDTK